MKTILICFLLLFQTNLSAQKWCPEGATWYGSVYGKNITSGYQKLTYIKDTMVQGQACKKITAFSEYMETMYPFKFKKYANFSIYTYAKDDTVFFLYKNAFLPGLFFNAKKDDTLVINKFDFNQNYSGGCDSIIKAVVDSTGKEVIQGDTLRFYFISALNKQVLNPKRVKILEKFGSISDFLSPVYSCVYDLGGVSFKCYEDKFTPLFNFSYSSAVKCDDVESDLDDIKIQEPLLSYYQKETQLILEIAPEASIQQINLLNTSGQLKCSALLQNRQRFATIPTDKLNPGIYLLQFKNSLGQSFTKKLNLP